MKLGDTNSEMKQQILTVIKSCCLSMICMNIENLLTLDGTAKQNGLCTLKNKKERG